MANPIVPLPELARGTRCRIYGLYAHPDHPEHNLNGREVTLKSGPLYPAHLSRPGPFYEICASWIAKEQEQVGKLIAHRDQLLPINVEG